MKEIVIRIPEKTYEVICKSGSGAPLVIDEAIRNGTLLPKGHGRLIDENDMWDAYIDAEYDFYEALDIVKTIVEADKEGAENDSN